MNAEEMRAALGNPVIGREILILPETTSTNDEILARLTPETPEGLVIFAEHQTAGRGQRSNRWESIEQKGLWFSILLRPRLDIGESPRLTAWAAQTVAQTIRQEFSLTPTIKSPNDIQIGDRKVAGVLVEMRAQPAAPHIAIAGIGINVNHAPEDFSEELGPRAISLSMALDRNVDRQQFAVALLRNLDMAYCETFAISRIQSR